MILLCGIPSEPPLAMVRAQLEARGDPYVLFNQRHFADMFMDLEITNQAIRGALQIDGRPFELDAIRGIYIRLMDDQFLPEVRDLPVDAPLRRYCRALHDTLIRWSEVTPARIVNRIGAMNSNISKPYQAQLIRKCGFDIPETLITNDPELVIDFRRQQGQVIYKSISGVRSIVKKLSDEDLTRLDHIRWCPTQFQAYVEGTDVRVHVVDGAVFATAIHSPATDYRYALDQSGTAATLEATDIPDALAERCVALSRALGLVFSGIDLKLAPDGRVYCFEVNPCPAFSYYEANTGQPIAQAVAEYLAGA